MQTVLLLNTLSFYLAEYGLETLENLRIATARKRLEIKWLLHNDRV